MQSPSPSDSLTRVDSDSGPSKTSTVQLQLENSLYLGSYFSNYLVLADYIWILTVISIC